MNRKINQLIDFLSIENHFKVYSSFFRLFICFHLLKDIYYYWDYIPIIYANSSFYSSQPTYLLELLGLSSNLVRNNINIFIPVYIFLIGMYAFGVGRYFTAVLLFLCFEIIQRLCHVILNGGDNLMKFCLLYMVLIDSYRYFSLTKARSIKFSSYRNFISNIGGYLICIHTCIVYFFSAAHKIHADVWFNGIATYYTFLLERFKGTGLNDHLGRNGFFVTVTTYATLLIEISYPFLVWFRQTKLPVIICAVLMHISIYVFMMIYDFQIVFIAVQGFFISNALWYQWYNRAKLKVSSIWKTK